MTSSSSDVAWEMASTEVFKQIKRSEIFIPLQKLLPKSNSAKMISSDIALVQTATIVHLRVKTSGYRENL